jgi:hypothetical protein
VARLAVKSACTTIARSQIKESLLVGGENVEIGADGVGRRWWIY